jgi:RNA polymerase sigma-70 factor (sigma-E family)
VWRDIGLNLVPGRRRDEVEFREFVERASATLLRAACLLLHDRDGADDAVQQTLLRTFRRWDRARESPEAYSHSVLVNVCRNHWRDQRRRPIGTPLESEHEPLAAVRDKTPEVEDHLMLEQALAKLPGQQREVLVLRFFLDLSVAETARILGTQDGTVKSATHRGLESLRKLLNDQTQEVGSVR